MRLPLAFHPAVQQELDEAYSWYEQRCPGLGGDFLDEAERTLMSITANPLLCGFVDRDIRASSLKRFPFAVYYRVLQDRIRILAIYHASRDRAGWQSRD